MNIETLLDTVNNMMQTKVSNMRKFKPDEIGLDYRCGSVWVDSECIIISKNNDRSLQYYAGFEYVDNISNRVELGEYVVYIDTNEDDERISDVIEAANNLV